MLAAAAATSLLAGCSGDYSALDPAGPAAQSIARLWWAMLAGSAALLALVLGLFVLAVLRPKLARQFSDRAWIVGGGIAMPAPILLLLLHFSLFQGEMLIAGAAPQESAEVRVEARARQWQWEFRNLDHPQAAPSLDVLKIPARTRVEVTVVSEDVIHSFWVPRLAGKVDAVPGHANSVVLFADRPGSYGGVCSEYCGRGHAGMRFRVEVGPAPQPGEDR